MSRLAWSPAAVALLARLYASPMHIDRIAAAVGRNREGVQQKALRCGLVRHPKPETLYSMGRVPTVQDLLAELLAEAGAAGLSMAQLQQLSPSRSRSAISAAMAELIKHGRAASWVVRSGRYFACAAWRDAAIEAAAEHARTMAAEDGAAARARRAAREAARRGLQTRLVHLVKAAGPAGITFEILRGQAQISRKAAIAASDALLASGEIVKVEGHKVARRYFVSAADAAAWRSPALPVAKTVPRAALKKRRWAGAGDVFAPPKLQMATVIPAHVQIQQIPHRHDERFVCDPPADGFAALGIGRYLMPPAQVPA